MDTPILEMIDIKKSFSGIYALSGINLSLEEGEVHALLGENGAGKSTLIKILGGIYRPDSGTIRIKGEEVEIHGVRDAEMKGIGIVHQEIVLVPQLTVAQNIFLGRELMGSFSRVKRKEMNIQAEEMLQNLGVSISPTTPVSSLTIAQQQMIEIVKAVSFQAKIIVMDEPSSSLSVEEVEQLFQIIARLKEKKISIIYISHRMEEIFRIADRITVIRDGCYIGTKKNGETDVDELISMMVGRELKEFSVPKKQISKSDEIILEVKNLSCRPYYSDISFQLHKGEILGFAGLVGAGRSELMESIFGARHFTEGEVFLRGEQVHFFNPMQAIKAGIGFVTEDRKKTGLVLGNTVSFNLSLASLDKYQKGIFLEKDKMDESVQYYTDRLNIKSAALDVKSTQASNLSGGNQQKIVIGKWLATTPSILILDEPTRGIDIHAKLEIYNLINELAEGGMSILLVSSDLPEIIQLCDRVCVLKEGIMTGVLDSHELEQENIMRFAAGGESA